MRLCDSLNDYNKIVGVINTIISAIIAKMLYSQRQADSGFLSRR